MGHVDPEKLKLLRSKKGLSQQALADAIDVAPKTIGRYERGESGPRGETLRKLAEVLNTSVEDLAKPPQSDDDKFMEKHGYRRAYIYLSHQDRLHYRFLEARYGVKAHNILQAAPLLFLIAAEMSLAERRKRLDEFDEALSKVRTDHLSHLHEAVVGVQRADNATYAEYQSIKARDLSGKALRNYEWSDDYKGSGDLFGDFLNKKAHELCPDAVDDILGTFDTLSVWLFDGEIERLANGNPDAKGALAYGDVHPQDIPSDLLAEDQAEARATWLAERISDKTRAYLDEKSAFLKKLKL